MLEVREGTSRQDGEAVMPSAGDSLSLHASALAAIPATPLGEEEWRAFNEAKTVLLGATLTLRLPEEIAAVIPKPDAGDATREETQKSDFVFQLALQEHADRIFVRRSGESMRATLDPASIEAFLSEHVAPLLQAPENARILALPAEGNLRASVEGGVRDGWMIPRFAPEIIADAIASGTLDIVIPVEQVKGKIVNDTGWNLGALELLARGRSSFRGSLPNRAANIRKALEEHLDDVLVAPHERFSFNAVLGGSVDIQDGWKMAMGIFAGGVLAPTTGGGICQVSTTLYRALVQAGLPVEERHPHSLYITYYKEHGEGLDAAVYIGDKDLVFRNNSPGYLSGSPGYLFLQARTQGDEAIVEIYGTPDGRRVALDGPYRFHNAPEDLLVPEGRDLRQNEIAWRQRITHKDGFLEEHILTARYRNTIPWKTPEGAGEL